MIGTARTLLLLLATLTAPLAWASGAQGGAETTPDLTGSGYGIVAVLIFVVAYLLVMGEEFLHLRKSKPVMLAAGLVWIMVALAYQQAEVGVAAETLLRHNLLEYAELFLFLLAAMTYINAMEERHVFRALRAWLVSRGFSLRTIFWLTGLLAFCISPVADNLTTTLLMAAVVMAVAGDNRRFTVLGCINIVVAANAGGAFSPFGDITTLMVWQKGLVQFQEFFLLLLPSLVNWLVPALLMTPAVPGGKPEGIREQVQIKKGGVVMIVLFLLTIGLAVSFHNFLHLVPAVGMMTGLALLQFYGYFLKRADMVGPEGGGMDLREAGTPKAHYDIFRHMERAEWDTLMFFYGVVLCVGGLGALGYLAVLSDVLYTQAGPLAANVLVGFISAIVDNIPVMFAVLSMSPDMSQGHWLLITLTAGVGGSLLSIGSAAGVALMGQARGVYTFVAHLKWSWAILLGYAASIYTHLLLNARLM
jgi:NhaD family Na+/H+ antiporter